MKNIMFGMLVLGVLCMVGNVWGYDTYVGVTLTETIPPGVCFDDGGTDQYSTNNTRIVISAVGYSKTLNHDADGKWCEGETTYTDLVTLTEGVEYTVDVIADGYTDVTYDNPTVEGLPPRVLIAPLCSTVHEDYCRYCKGEEICISITSAGAPLAPTAYSITSSCTVGSSGNGSPVGSITCRRYVSDYYHPTITFIA